MFRVSESYQQGKAPAFLGFGVPAQAGRPHPDASPGCYTVAKTPKSSSSSRCPADYTPKAQNTEKMNVYVVKRRTFLSRRLVYLHGSGSVSHSHWTGLKHPPVTGLSLWAWD